MLARGSTEPLGLAPTLRLGFPNPDGSPYWDQTSLDGTNMNIGLFLAGTGAFAGEIRTARTWALPCVRGETRRP